MTRRSVLLGLVFATLLTACGGARDFQRQEGLVIAAPAAHSWHRQPVEVRWEVTDPALREQIETGEVALGVFVDRPPIGPGDNLFDLADEDCERDEDCPDAVWFAERQIYVTRQTSLALSSLRDNRTSDAADARDPHEAIIVVLDDAGYRIGERYFSIQFAIDRTR